MAPHRLAWLPQARLTRLPPAKLRRHELQDALDGVSVVLDAELVRNGQQERVGGLDRGVPGELPDEGVGLRGVRAPEGRLGLRIEVANLIRRLVAAAEVRAVPIIDQGEDAAADRHP